MPCLLKIVFGLVDMQIRCSLANNGMARNVKGLLKTNFTKNKLFLLFLILVYFLKF